MLAPLMALSLSMARFEPFASSSMLPAPALMGWLMVIAPSVVLTSIASPLVLTPFTPATDAMVTASASWRKTPPAFVARAARLVTDVSIGEGIEPIPWPESMAALPPEALMAAAPVTDPACAINAIVPLPSPRLPTLKAVLRTLLSSSMFWVSAARVTSPLDRALTSAPTVRFAPAVMLILLPVVCTPVPAIIRASTSTMTTSPLEVLEALRLLTSVSRALLV